MALDPFDQLVALGAISQAQYDSAMRVSDDVVATTFGRLVAVGVDSGLLLRELGRVASMPVATIDTANIAPLNGVPGTFARTMHELCAAPVGRDDNGTLLVIVADPRASKSLSAAGIAHRASLASEIAVLDALYRAFPDYDDAGKPPANPSDTARILANADTLEAAAASPRPITMPAESAFEGAATRSSPSILGDITRSTTEEPRSTSSLPSAVVVGNSLSQEGALSTGDTKPEPRAPGPISALGAPVPSTKAPLPAPATTGGGGMSADAFASIAPASAPAVRDPLARAPPGEPALALAPVARSSTSSPSFPVATVEVSPVSAGPAANGASASSAAASAPGAGFDAVVGQARVLALRLVDEAQRKPKVAAGVGGGALLVLVLLIVIVAGHKSEPADERTPQRKLLDEAVAFAKQGDHAWAFAKCSDAMKLDPTTSDGKAARIVCGEQDALLGEREGLFDLQKLVGELGPDDPLRGEAEAALARVKIKLESCDACAKEDEPAAAAATTTPKVTKPSSSSSSKKSAPKSSHGTKHK